MVMKKQTLIITVMAVALIISLSYIAFDYFQKINVDEQNAAFQSGAQFGYEQAVLQLLQQSTTCQPVPVTAGNLTLNLIATECLQPVEQPAE
jgi:hypothetical protein